MRIIENFLRWELTQKRGFIITYNIDIIAYVSLLAFHKKKTKKKLLIINKVNNF